MTILPKKPKPNKERGQPAAAAAQPSQQQQQPGAQTAAAAPTPPLRLAVDLPSSSGLSGTAAPAAAAGHCAAGRSAAGRKQLRGAAKKYKVDDGGSCSTNSKLAASSPKQHAAETSGSAETELAELEARFAQHLLKAKGLRVKQMQGDGACLFRAVADQVYGDEDMHANVRTLCMDYMEKNRDHFSQFVTEDFGDYITRKRAADAHGNHVEMQAMAEIFNRPILVFEYSVDPMNTFQPDAGADNPPIRVSYHGGSHYNSVVDPYGATIGVGLGLPQLYPGGAEATLMREAAEVSERDQIEQTMLKDKLAATDWEATDEHIQQQIKRDSYLQWLREQETAYKPPMSCSSTPRSSSTVGPPAANSPAAAATADATMAFDCPGPSSSRAADQPSGSGRAAPPAADDEDIMAQVLALSQQEYYDSLASKHAQS